MRSKKSGFTLVEVLISFMILGLVVVFFSYFSGGNYKAFKQSDERSRVAVYAQDVVERVKISWSNPANFLVRSAVAVPTPPKNYTVDPISVEFLNPSGNVVTSGTYFTNPVLYRVTVTIKYKGSVYYRISVRIGHPVPPTT